MFKNSLKAYQIYRRLTDEEKTILETRKISGKHSIREWNRKLSHIAIMDAYADKARQGLKTALMLSLFLTFFISLFLLGAFLFLRILIPVIGVSIFLIALFFYQKLKGIDVGNQLRYFIIPTLKLLNKKVRKNHKVELEINLALPDEEAYLIHEEEDKSPADRRFRRINTFQYQVPWLKGKAPLADGSLLIWENEDLVRVRKVVKVRKGKRKTKFKLKHITKVQLMVPKARYALTSERMENIQVDESERYHILTLKGKEKTAVNPNVQGDHMKSMNPKYFTGLLIQAYQQLEPIKPQTA